MIKHVIYIYITLLSSISFAQDSAAVDLLHPTIRIGEQTQLKLSFYYKTIDTTEIQWPQFDNYITNEVEIINKTEISTSPIQLGPYNFIKQQILTITAFEPDSLIIPSLAFSYQDSLYITNEIPLLVNTVKIDTSKGITDLKPIYAVEYPVTEQISDWSKDNWYIFLIIALLIIIFILYVKYKNRPVIEVPEPEIFIPAHIKALEVLAQLKSSQAWENDNKKVYYSELTNTVRQYLEDRYSIQALEKTTREIIQELKYTNISVDDKYFLREILKQADFVKFAKFLPSDTDGKIALDKSFEFVEKTKIEEDVKTQISKDHVE